MAKTPQIPISPETHSLLKRYCALKGKKMSQIGDQWIRERLETEHITLESQGDMMIEGEKPKPEIRVFKEKVL